MSSKNIFERLLFGPTPDPDLPDVVRVLAIISMLSGVLLGIFGAALYIAIYLVGSGLLPQIIPAITEPSLMAGISNLVILLIIGAVSIIVGILTYFCGRYLYERSVRAYVIYILVSIIFLIIILIAEIWIQDPLLDLMMILVMVGISLLVGYLLGQREFFRRTEIALGGPMEITTKFNVEIPQEARGEEYLNIKTDDELYFKFNKILKQVVIRK